MFGFDRDFKEVFKMGDIFYTFFKHFEKQKRQQSIFSSRLLADIKIVFYQLS
jgi:hypothetical protein